MPFNTEKTRYLESRALRYFGFLVFSQCLLAPLYAETFGLFYDADQPQHEFAANDIRTAMEGRGEAVEIKDLSEVSSYSGKKIVIGLASNTQLNSALATQGGEDVSGLVGQAYALRTTTSPFSYWVVGGDERGAMYGGLDLAEKITFDGLSGAYNEEEAPHILNRGIKFNIPLDDKAPTYFLSHRGKSHQVAIEHVWDMSFWTTWFDEMARHRYNVLSLWTNNPFVSMLNMTDEGYPDVHITGVTDTKGNVINNWSIERKVDFWREVMQHGKNRGFDIHFITWNIFLQTAEGKHGITKEKGDQDTINYFKASMIKFLETYPNLAGFGVTAGEGMGGYSDSEKEAWLWQTYGEGMLEYSQANPNRPLTFIHRQHQTGADDVLEYFSPLDDLENVRLDMSFKYSKAHMYGTATPTYINGGSYLDQLNSNNVKTWLELRTDSFYFLQWADPQFAREYITNFPKPTQDFSDSDQYTVGTFMGADGWVSTRDFTSKNSIYADKLEIQKNWYMQKVWGRLLYNPNTSDAVFKDHLENKYPQVNSELLFQAWSNASRAVQLANEQLMSSGWNLDYQYWPEASTAKETQGGWKTLDDMKDSEPMKGSKLCSIEDSAEEECRGKLSAFTNAENIQTLASSSLALLKSIDAGSNIELMLNLRDIKALANLGLYFSNKFLSALYLEQNNSIAGREAMGVSYCHWIEYTDIMEQLYTGAQTQRNINLNSWKMYDDEVLNDYRKDANGSGTPSCNSESAGNVEPKISPWAPETLPWVEDFNLSNGIASDYGSTSWSATENMDVQGNEIRLTFNGSEGVLRTGKIDIRGEVVEVSLDLSSEGRLEEGQDYVKLFKKVDDGSEVLIGEVSGNQVSVSITENAITGDYLELVIRAYVSHSSEHYFLDNLAVNATQSQPPVTPQLLWLEKFDQPDGTIADMGATDWVASRTTGSLQIQSGTMTTNGPGDEGVLTTGEIDISGQSVEISFDLSSEGNLETDQDYVQLFIKVDGSEKETLVAERWGNQTSELVSVTGVEGETLEIVIRSYVSYRTEYYYIDNLKVFTD